MTEETKEKLRAAGREDLIEIHEINQSGYAGVLPNGNIVDRRKHPEAVPVQKNSIFNIPEPQALINQNLNYANFWERAHSAHTEGVESFCVWIDQYKAQINWPALFNGGRAYQALNQDGEGETVTVNRTTTAPKFHDLPLAMQLGILQQFAEDQAAPLRRVGMANPANYFTPKLSFGRQILDALSFFELLTLALKIGK